MLKRYSPGVLNVMMMIMAVIMATAAITVMVTTGCPSVLFVCPPVLYSGIPQILKHSSNLAMGKLYSTVLVRPLVLWRPGYPAVWGPLVIEPSIPRASLPSHASCRVLCPLFNLAGCSLFSAYGPPATWGTTAVMAMIVFPSVEEPPILRGVCCCDGCHGDERNKTRYERTGGLRRR